MTDRIADACEMIVRWGLVALIVFTPLAFGTVETWSIAIMEWGIVTLVLFECAGRALRPGDRPALMPWRSGLALPLFLFVALALFQLVPLPAGWLQKIAPGSAQAYAWAPVTPPESSVSQERAQEMVDRLDLGAMPVRRPVSIDPEATRSQLRLLGVFLALFFLAASWANRRERVLFLITSVGIVGFLVALFGLVQRLTWNGKIYWLRAVQSQNVMGPFVNRNHFAGYVEMVIPLALSLAFFLLDSRRRSTLDDEGERDADENGDDSGEVLEITEPFMDRWGQFALAFFTSIVLVVSLFFSESRGGILSAILSGFVLFVVLWDRIPSRAVAWSIALGFPILIGLFTLWVGRGLLSQGSTVVQDTWREASFSSRYVVWKTMVHQMPLAGYAGFGLGAFEDSFARFTPPGSSARWDRAHNDYLQLAWETGFAGSLLLLWGGLAFAYRYLWPAVRGRDHPLDLFRAAIAISLLSIALHSCVDFNMQIGSNGFLFALLAGTLVGIHSIVGRDRTPVPSANSSDSGPRAGLRLP